MLLLYLGCHVFHLLLELLLLSQLLCQVFLLLIRPSQLLSQLFDLLLEGLLELFHLFCLLARAHRLSLRSKLQFQHLDLLLVLSQLLFVSAVYLLQIFELLLEQQTLPPDALSGCLMSLKHRAHLLLKLLLPVPKLVVFFDQLGFRVLYICLAHNHAAGV